MYKLLLCSRYLKTRYIALACIVSVMLGVATMIVVNSVMAGFSTEMRERIHGILADMVVETHSLDGAYDPEREMQRIQQVAGEFIEAMTPTVEVYGILSFKYGASYIPRPVTLIGIEPASKSKVGTLTSHLLSYKPERDSEGNEIGPPGRSADEPPDWELLPHYLEIRRARMRDPALRFQEPLAPEQPVAGDAGAADDDEIFSKLAEGASSSKKTNAGDPAAPLKARVYVGSQLVSFQYTDKETNKSKTFEMIGPGDDVKISTVSTGQPPEAVHFDATVIDIFQSGMSEYDSSLVFVNLEALQEVRNMFDPNSGERDPVTKRPVFKTCTKAFTTIQIRLKNYADAGKVMERLRAELPPNKFRISTWEQKQGPLLQAVEVESAILNVLLFLIIAVAGFGILAIFFMIVVEKTRDIGILKSLGASSQGVLSIFLSYGLSLGLVGAGVGVVVGLLFVRYINEIEAGLTRITGRKVFDETIYYFPSIPTKVHPMMVFWVAFGAMAIAVLASILPARRAAALSPVQALRNE